MSPNTGAAALLLFLALSGPAPAWAAEARRPPEKESRSELPYQTGLTRYARGDRGGALAAFREALRRDPADRLSIAAVRRLESELAAQAPATSAPSGGADASRLERLLLVKIPRWYHFGRTVGNSLSAVGTAEAINARISQLLGERSISLARKRPFRNERLLRELIRRAPLAARETDEV